MSENVTKETLVNALKDRGIPWATETTLASINDKIGAGNGILALLAKKQDIHDDKIKQFVSAVDDSTDAMNEETKARYKAAQAAIEERRRQATIKQNEREQNYQYRQSLDDLRSQMSKVRPDKWGAAAEDVFGKVTGSLSETGKAGLYAAKSLQALYVGMTMLYGIGKEYGDTMARLIDSGMTFGGVMEDFGIAVGKSGLGLQGYTSLLEKHSESVARFGEKQYAENLRSFRQMNAGVNYLGMLPQQLGEAYSQHLDDLRSGGLLYLLDQKQSSVAIRDLILQEEKLSAITGKKREAIEAEQDRAAAKTKILLTIAGIAKQYGPEVAAAVRQRYGYAEQALGETEADIQFQQQFGLGYTREQAKYHSIAQIPDNVLDFFHDQGFGQGIAAIQKRQAGGSPELYNVLARSSTLSGGLTGVADLVKEDVLRTMPFLKESRETQQKVALIAQGKLATGAQASYLSGQAKLADAQGNLIVATMELAKAFGVLKATMGAFSMGTGALSAMGGYGMMGLAGAMYGLPLLGKTKFIQSVLKRGGGAGGGLGSLKGLLGSIGGGELGGVAGGGAGTAELLGGGLAASSLLPLLGIGAGIGGLAYFGNMAATSKTRGGKIGGLLGSAGSGALSGASLGFLVGGPLGAAIGGILGGGTGLLYGGYKAYKGSTASNGETTTEQEEGTTTPTPSPNDIITQMTILNNNLYMNQSYVASLARLQRAVQESMTIQMARNNAVFVNQPEYSNIHTAHLQKLDEVVDSINSLSDTVKMGNSDLSKAVQQIS